jgi:hypothetical protein
MVTADVAQASSALASASAAMKQFQSAGSAVAAPVTPFDASVSERMAQVAQQYQILGQSAEEAGASAGLLKERVESAVTGDAKSRIESLAPPLKESATLFTKLSEEMGNIGKQAAGMATGILAADLVMGVAERFKSAAEQIDTYGQAVLMVSRISGESAEASSTLVAMFERFAPSVDVAITRLGRFEKVLAGQEDVLGSVTAGGKTASEYLAEFGVQATDASGRLKPTTDILLDLAEGFHNSGDAAQKNGALVALFGRGSQDMMLMLDQGKASLQEFMAKVKEYGLVLSGENVADVQAFIFAHKDMDMALQGVALQLGASFMPSVTKAAEITRDFAQAISGGAVPAIKEFGDLKMDWLVPATAGTLLLGSALQVIRFALAGIGGAFAAFAIGVYGAMQPLLDAVNILYQLKDAFNAMQDPNALQSATKDLLNRLPARGFPSATEQPSAAAAADPTGTSTGVKSATAKKDAATAQLQDINDAASQRKSDFDIAHVGAEQNMLDLKMQQAAADQATLIYKRQLEDLDRNSVNFAQQRLQLDEQAAVLRAQQAESPLKAQNDDIRYQEERIKAQLKAAHAGGPAVDAGALHQQLRDLNKQDARMQPALLDAGHNVALANRAKSDTDLAAGLDANGTAHTKLAIDEAMAPAAAAAVLASRAVQDAQTLLDIDKNRFAFSEMAYTSEKLLAEAAEKAAAHTLFVLQHPDANVAPASAKSAPPPTFDYKDQAPREGPMPVASQAAPVFQFNIGQIGQSAEEVWDAFKGQFVAAWNAAMNGHPVSGALGGSYQSRGGGIG